MTALSNQLAVRFLYDGTGNDIPTVGIKDSDSKPPCIIELLVCALSYLLSHPMDVYIRNGFDDSKGQWCPGLSVVRPDGSIGPSGATATRGTLRKLLDASLKTKGDNDDWKHILSLSLWICTRYPDVWWMWVNRRLGSYGLPLELKDVGLAIQQGNETIWYLIAMVWSLKQLWQLVAVKKQLPTAASEQLPAGDVPSYYDKIEWCGTVSEWSLHDLTKNVNLIPMSDTTREAFTTLDGKLARHRPLCVAIAAAFAISKSPISIRSKIAPWSQLLSENPKGSTGSCLGQDTSSVEQPETIPICFGTVVTASGWSSISMTPNATWSRKVVSTVELPKHPILPSIQLKLSKKRKAMSPVSIGSGGRGPWHALRRDPWRALHIVNGLEQLAGITSSSFTFNATTSIQSLPSPLSVANNVLVTATPPGWRMAIANLETNGLLHGSALHGKQLCTVLPLLTIKLWYLQLLRHSVAGPGLVLRQHLMPYKTALSAEPFFVSPTYTSVLKQIPTSDPIDLEMKFDIEAAYGAETIKFLSSLPEHNRPLYRCSGQKLRRLPPSKLLIDDPDTGCMQSPWLALDTVSDTSSDVALGDRCGSSTAISIKQALGVINADGSSSATQIPTSAFLQQVIQQCSSMQDILWQWITSHRHERDVARLSANLDSNKSDTVVG